MNTTPSRRVRTRFPPSPTGYLHIGGARTALFSWAFARHFGGDFVFRIEDTDLERSTPEAVQAIFDGMAWLDLKHDEGPFYQMQRIARYQEVIAEMLKAGTAYHCYSSKEELEAMRAAQEAAGLKAKYDGRWRPEPGKVLPLAPQAVRPVVRFRNPLDGDVTWNDMVKGPVTIANAEMDDLVIARPDGTPTYNFCVVVDDIDMRISHVIRGDDHVNNTPRQINIMRALGAEVPEYGHLPLIHGADGQKLSKRHGAVAVTQFDDEGYLREAVINYLARLGWSHGDEEKFSREQFVQWFDGSNINKSAARFDYEKLKWLNNLYLRELPNDDLVRLVKPRLEKRGVDVSTLAVDQAVACSIWKERAGTLEELAENVALFFQPKAISTEDKAKHLDAVPALPDAMNKFKQGLATSAWEPAALTALIKEVLAATGLKMPQLAVPVRLKVFGLSQTPSLDRMLCALPREEVLKRLD